MNNVVWGFSIVLALTFLITGVFRVFKRDAARKHFHWAGDMPPVLLQFIGIGEILGALGLILPVATGIYPWLTVVAAIGLALLMLMAGTFHMARRETSDAGLNIVLLLLAAFVAYGRWTLLQLT